MKLAGVVVLYNPDQKVIQNITSYINEVDVLYLVDNSSKDNSLLFTHEKAKYIPLHGNTGIAHALNVGATKAIDNGFHYLLTMDQDSLFPTKYYQDIIKLVDKYKEEYSVIGLNFNQENCESDEVVEIPCWLTSGNFVNIDTFNLIGKFDERLFIDYVDIELGYKLSKSNLKICYLKNYSLKHEIGNPIEIHLFGKTYHAMNHSPIRYYYRYRNAYYLYHYVDKDFFRKEYFKEITINIIKMLVYEKNQKEKLSMIRKGIKDAKSKKLGKFYE